jgi:hypothetical protein
MRTWFPQHRSVTVIANLVLVSALWGTPPQEGRMPRSQPQGPGDRGSLQPAAAPQAQPDAPSSRPNQRSGPSRSSIGVVRPRVNRVYIYPGTRTVVPPGWVRCSTMPDMSYWGQRDLMGEIQWLSRTGYIPVSPVGDSVDALSDYVQVPAGWRAYGISVPVGGTVQVEVQHTKVGWFRLMLMNKWGYPDAGMLQAATAYQPVMVTYKNPSKEATAIYVVVDDPAWWSDAYDPYTLLVRRDWDPARTDLSQVKMVAGLWGATPSVSAEFRGPSLSGPAVYPH